MTSDFSFLHEVEGISFTAGAPRTVSEVEDFLMSSGFSLHEDVFSLDRKGRVPPWQHSSIVEVKFLLDGAEQFDLDGKWDRLDFEYLYAALPSEYVSTFVDVVMAAAKVLNLPPFYQGKEVSREDLERIFQACANDLDRELGESAGSESLAIYIQQTYPR